MATMTVDSVIYEQMLARVKELEAKQAEEKRKAERKANSLDLGNGMTGRISEKGGFSVYGLGRFPVTLYFEQWMKLLSVAAKLGEALTVCKAAGKLAVKRAKDEKDETPELPN